MTVGAFLPSLLGGMAIGLAAAILMALNGRVAGVSGILSGLWRNTDAGRMTSLAFVIGLVLGPVLFLAVFGTFPKIEINTPLWLLALGGVLVGYGSRLGSGCTSGHGVVGLARLSPRSMAAVATFLTAAVVTVAAMRAAGLS